MTRARSSRGAVCILAVLVGAAFPVCRAGVDEALSRMAKQAGQGQPLVRIGLEDGESLEIDASGPYRILDPKTGRNVWQGSYAEPIQVVADGAPAGGVARVYRIQVGAFSSAAAAERERDRMRAATGAPGVVRHDPDRGNWRVRLGKSKTRSGLNSLLERLREMGLQQLWIAEEAAAEIKGVDLRLVDSRWQSH